MTDNTDNDEVTKLMMVKLDATSKMLELQREVVEVNKQLVKLRHAHLAVRVADNW